jgi:TolB-like protein
MKSVLSKFFIVTSLLSLSNIECFAQENSNTDEKILKDSKINNNNLLELNLKVVLPYFTILDKKLNSNFQVSNFNNNLRERLQGVKRLDLIENKEVYKNDRILTSDQIIPIGLNTGTDLVLTGTISKMGEDIIVNMRLSETVIGKVLLDKQYFSKKNDLTNILNQIVDDLNSFMGNLKDYDIDIYNLNSGNSLIRVKSIPSGAKVSLDSIEMGKTPLTLKNISEKEHIIETWLEKDGFIKDLNILSEDNQMFQFKFDNKTYTETIVEIDDLIKSPEGYDFEIIPNPDDKRELKERPKATDIKYDLRRFKMEIFTEPQNLQVVLDNKDVGVSPITIDKILPGKHNIKLAKKKLIVFKKLVDSSKNKITELDFNMFKLGRLFVSSNPLKAEIFINNEKLGETPKSIDIPFGEHDIDIRRDGYKNETYKVYLKENVTSELNIDLASLRNINTNISYLPTGLVDDVLGVSSVFLSLGQYNSSDNKLKGLTYLYGGEVNYGFKNLLSLGEYFKFSAQVGAFYNKLSTFTINKDFPSNQGLGAKIQFLNQSDTIPVSAAIGGFYNFNNSLNKQLNGYVAISRDFKFISVNLGVQVQPFKLSAVNLSLDYNKFYRIKLGATVLIDFGLLADKPGEYITPLFGVNAGYNFF